MKAVVRHRYGSPDQLRYEDVPAPTPADDEVLIQLCAASINPLDRFLLQGFPWNQLPGLRTPKVKILGCDIAGRVEALGKNVHRVERGDAVFGITGFQGTGFAEFVCVREEALAHKPAELSFAEAAALPVAAVTALQALRDHARVQPGHSVLIEGASGGVGTFALQIAKALGAKVTAVCSTAKLERARLLGADQVVDYTTHDFTRSGERYDRVVAINAEHSLFAYRRVLTPDGICVVLGGKMRFILAAWLAGPLLSALGSKKFRFFVAKIQAKDLAALSELVESGKLRSVIDKCFPLSAAADAMKYLAEGHASGKIVLIAQAGSFDAR